MRPPSLFIGFSLKVSQLNGSHHHHGPHPTACSSFRITQRSLSSCTSSQPTAGSLGNDNTTGCSRAWPAHLRPPQGLCCHLPVTDPGASPTQRACLRRTFLVPTAQSISPPKQSLRPALPFILDLAGGPQGAGEEGWGRVGQGRKRAGHRCEHGGADPPARCDTGVEYLSELSSQGSHRDAFPHCPPALSPQRLRLRKHQVLGTPGCTPLMPRGPLLLLWDGVRDA